MALGFAGLAGAISAAAAAAANVKKNNNTSGTRRPSGSSSKTYTYTDSDGRTHTTTEQTDWAAKYYDAIGTGDLASAQAALDLRAQKMGGDTDSWQDWASGYLSSYQQNLRRPAQQVAEAYADRTNQYLQAYTAQQQALRAEQQAKVDANIAELNAQKPKVQQAGAQANQAAQQNYMNVLNPNGANAEQLAALGLTESGLSETAAISANNAYTQAVNANEQNVANQLAAIDLAITQAQLSGDLATAQQLQSYYNTVLNAGLQQAQTLANLGQWGVENMQNQVQQGVDNAFTQAGLTGELYGQPTMAGQQLSYTIEGMDLENQLQQYALLLQRTYGMDQAAAELRALQLANESAAMGMQTQLLENEYQKLYNQYQQIVNQGAQIANQGALLENQHQQIVNNRLFYGLD